MPQTRRARGLLVLPFVLALLPFLRPGPLAAQVDCTTDEPPCPDDPLGAFLSPGSGEFTSASLGVEVRWVDEQGIDPGTRQIVLNGASVIGSFVHSGPNTQSVSSGTLTLQPGANNLWVRVCDGVGQCTENGATYTYTPPPPPRRGRLPCSAWRRITRATATSPTEARC